MLRCQGAVALRSCWCTLSLRVALGAPSVTSNNGGQFLGHEGGRESPGEKWALAEGCPSRLPGFLVFRKVRKHRNDPEKSL